MRVYSLGLTVGFATLGGCALLYNYGDYHDQDAATGGGGTNVGGSTNTSGSGGSSSSAGGAGGSGGAAGGGGVAGGQPCLVTEACPTTGKECAPMTCQQGSCVTNLVLDGMPTKAQTPYDCKINVCDGNGNITVSADPADLPDDGNECTQDVCSGMTPDNPPQPSGADCGDISQGLICNGAGTCTQCTSNDSCKPLQPEGNAVCKAWTCNAQNVCSMVADANNPPCSSQVCIDSPSIGSHTEISQCNNGLCQLNRTSCQGYLCDNPFVCSLSCSASMVCNPGYTCNGGSCDPCVTCAQWASPPIDFNPGAVLCSNSDMPREQLLSCACMSNACELQCPVLCGGVGSMTTDCTNCVFANCPSEVQSCQDTAVPPFP